MPGTSPKREGFARRKRITHWALRLRTATPCLAALAMMILLSDFASAQDPSRRLILHETPKAIAEFAFLDAAGETRTLADFRGRVILLNLWATWCAPCIREMPTLDRLQSKLGEGAFEVIALSLDRTDDKTLDRFLETIGVENLALYRDRTGAALAELKIIGLPTTLLIDVQGQEIARLIGPAEWDSPRVIEVIQSHLNGVGRTDDTLNDDANPR